MIHLHVMQGGKLRLIATSHTGFMQDDILDNSIQAPATIRDQSTKKPVLRFLSGQWWIEEHIGDIWAKQVPVDSFYFSSTEPSTERGNE